MSSNSSPPKYDDFGELVWKEPPKPKKKPKNFAYLFAFKRLGYSTL